MHELKRTGTGDDERGLAAARSGRPRTGVPRQGFSNVLRHPPEGTAGISVIRLPEQTLPAIRRVATRLADHLTRESPRGQMWIVDRPRIRMWPRKTS